MPPDVFFYCTYRAPGIHRFRGIIRRKGQSRDRVMWTGFDGWAASSGKNTHDSLIVLCLTPDGFDVCWGLIFCAESPCINRVFR